VTSNSGAVHSSQTYCAYGRKRSGTSTFTCGSGNSLPTDHTFTGQKLDGSGLQYFNARYYDPTLGTFISPDSLIPDPGNVYDWNRYMYTRGNPLKYTDPSGRMLIPCPNCEPLTLDYSNTSGIANTTVDLAATAYCFFAGCHVDRQNDVITGPTPEEQLDLTNSSLIGMVNPVSMVAGPGLSAGGGVLNQTIQAIIKKADDWVVRYSTEGTHQAAVAAAKSKVPVLPGLFKYNSEMLNISGYQRHHLWPEALGGPSDGWAIYIQTNPTNFHTARGGVQPWIDDQLMQRTGLGLDAMRQWARNNPQEVLSMLREIYHELGIDFPY
jgi:RHS repeat-associated protein